MSYLINKIDYLNPESIWMWIVTVISTGDPARATDISKILVEGLMKTTMIYKQNHVLNAIEYYEVTNHKLFLIHITACDKFEAAVDDNYLDTQLQSIGEIGISRNIIRNIVNSLYEASNILTGTYQNLLHEVLDWPTTLNRPLY